MNNRFDESRETIRQALTLTPAESRVQIYTATTWDAIYRGWVEAEQHLAKVFEMVESGFGNSNPLAIMQVLFSAGVPGYARKTERLCAAIGRGLTGPPNLTHASYHLLSGAVLLIQGDMAGSEREAELALAIGRDCGQIVLITAALCTTFAVIAAARGRWEVWTSGQRML
jgi:hypothetical protein